MPDAPGKLSIAVAVAFTFAVAFADPADGILLQRH
jgi:hypothetical protein